MSDGEKPDQANSKAKGEEPDKAEKERRAPVVPVPAATIMLLRDGPISPEVLMLQRHAKSEFLPDLYVFPGGRVDPGDHELADRVGGVDAEAAKALANTVDGPLALGFFVAAIRETFEEAGVLLARERGASGPVSGATASRLSQYRLEMQAGKQTLRALIERENLELAADALAVHGHWITPEMVPRRFDTLFFTAIAPPDHEATHDGVESSDHVWIRPEDALAQAKAKERQMIFPTLANLRTIAGFDSPAAILASSRKRRVVPILPTIAREGGETRMVIPEDAGYPTSPKQLELPSTKR